SPAALAREALDGLDCAGRPLGAANRELPSPDDPVASLWSSATVLREHRGDGHVAALVDAELDGVEAHVTLAAAGGPPRSVLQPARGWTDDEWTAAEERLRHRGLLGPDGTLSAAGTVLRAAVEDRTDRLAGAPWRTLGERRTEELAEALRPLASAVVRSGIIPGQNPMGLPRD
ncbi:MAG: SCO6745 family protein, partial [Acidimicrobiales bacterium]